MKYLNSLVQYNKPKINNLYLIKVLFMFLLNNKGKFILS
jgi:hypothetical protein